MKTSKQEIHKAQWQELIREQSESDLSIREWCRRHKYFTW
ncbi:IS66 family insertion sequence element accessory protein TnpA [Tissierella sp.]